MSARPATVHELDERAKDAANEATMLHPNLTTALLAAINDLGVVGKSQTANAGTYSYDYADLEAVTTEVKGVLSKHGLAVRTPVGGHPEGLAVTVKFLHVSGETLDDDPLPFPRGANAQATGSAITYFRRYALLASLNIATGEDDDGAKATHAAPSGPTPGFRSSVIDAMNALSPAEAKTVRAWAKEQGLPISPAQMSEDQAARVVDYILEALPKPDPAGSVPSENQADEK